MKKAELAKRAAERLREIRARKPVSIPAHTFHVSDDIGNTSDFKVKPSRGLSAYTIDDVNVILEALLYTVEKALENGESVSIHGFGSIRVKYYKPYQMKNPKTGEFVDVMDRYVPGVEIGADLRRAAKAYGLSLKDRIEKGAFVSQDEYDRYSFTSDDGDDD